MFLLRGHIKIKTELPNFSSVPNATVNIQYGGLTFWREKGRHLLEMKSKYHFLMELGFYYKLTSGPIGQYRFYVSNLEREK